MNNALIVYDTVSGSTGEMGNIIRTELLKKMEAVSMRVTDVASIGQYDVIIIGSPMRFGGFTRSIRKFIERHESELVRKKVVYFFSILYVVKIAEEESPEVTPYVDPTLAIKTISKKKANSIMDRTHSLGYYDKVIANCASKIKPLSIAYFKGRLVLNTLPILARIFMKVITLLTTKEQEGDFLNPASVREWAAGLCDVIQL